MKKIMLFFASLLPFISNAHPGHGETEGFTIKHYFTEPQHLVFIFLTMAVVIFFLGRRKEIQDVKKQKQQ
jgi:hypothetical protein